MSYSKLEDIWVDSNEQLYRKTRETFTPLVGVSSISPNPNSLVVRDATGVTELTGVRFPATQVADSGANVLDDYEEGTFTPRIEGSTSAGTGTYAAQSGYYTKVGSVVHIQIALIWTAHTGTGNMRVEGLPFTHRTGLSAIPLSLFHTGLTLAANSVAQLQLITGTTRIEVKQVVTGGGTIADVTIDTAAEIRISGTYLV